MIPPQAPAVAYSFVDGDGIIFPPNQEAVPLPVAFKLHQNYPNPFNQGTIIRYDLLQPRIVTLKVYDILGQLVATLVNEVPQPTGTYEVPFNSAGLASGVYIYRLEAGEFSEAKRMLLLK